MNDNVTMRLGLPDVWYCRQPGDKKYWGIQSAEDMLYIAVVLKMLSLFMRLIGEALQSIVINSQHAVR